MNEAHHNGDAAEEEDALEDVDARALEVKQVREGPAGGKGAAEHLGANQDRGAHHGHHVEPVDAAALGLSGGVHRSSSEIVGGNVVEMGGGIKTASCRKTGQIPPLTLPSSSAARSRSAGRGR